MTRPPHDPRDPAPHRPGAPGDGHPDVPSDDEATAPPTGSPAPTYASQGDNPAAPGAGFGIERNPHAGPEASPPQATPPGADAPEPPLPWRSPVPTRPDLHPDFHPGSAQPRLNRPLRTRYPQIRATSGYGDPRVRHTGPGIGAGVDQEPERTARLNGRLALAMSVVAGQLWGLTIVIDEWMYGNVGTAWWGAGFLGLSFLVVLGIWYLDPKDR